ncbi:MAG: hypothetical protein AAFX40_00650 [Cyanobacteria bacterium J06639_1]
MRKSFDRLLGRRWGSVVRGYWTWWRDRALERGGRTAVREAMQAYRAMQEQVEQLARTVRDQEQACDRAERLYLAKIRDYRGCEQQLQQARQANDATLERTVVYRAQRLERILPQLMDNVERGDRYLQAARQTLLQETERLETYRYHLHELVERDRANQTLSTLVRVTSSEGQKTRDRFDRAKAAVEHRQDYTQALYDLGEPQCDRKSQRPDALLEKSSRSRSLDSGVELNSEADSDSRSPAGPSQTSPPISPLQAIPPLRRPNRST